MTLLERYCAWSIEELNDETGLYTEEKLMVALDNIVTSKMEEKEIIKSFIQVSLELTSQVEPRWQEIAAKLYVINLYEEVRTNRGLEEGANPYDNFNGFIKELTDKGLYGKYILDNYSKEDIEELEKETGIIYPDYNTHTISYLVVNKLEKVFHNHKMLSLAKTKDIKEIIEWGNGQHLIAMRKLDG